jgi:hypothetical protein
VRGPRCGLRGSRLQRAPPRPACPHERTTIVARRLNFSLISFKFGLINVLRRALRRAMIYLKFRFISVLRRAMMYFNFRFISVLRRVLHRTMVHLNLVYLMCGVARLVARRFVLNSV